jgi:hypothetical protein
MAGILYKNNGDIIEILTDKNDYGYHKQNSFEFKTQTTNCIIFVENSFGFNFEKIYKSDKLEKVINNYIEIYGDFDKVLFILNEIIVQDESEFIKFSKKIQKPCYYANFDMLPHNNKYQLFIPLSIYDNLDYLIVNDYLNAEEFLKNMNKQYYNLQKPYKYSFYSNHVNPIRIDVFNILKATNNLKNGMWSFNDSVVYYSGEKHNLDSFFKDNEGIIPHSFDKYKEGSVSLKHTYLSEFLCYFEIATEAYFFRDVINIDNHCPITEKLIKPLIACLPFIVFGPKNLKSVLESIGMRFNSPLYGFYNITDDNSCREGYGHVTQQCIKPIEVIHTEYFKHIDEYEHNSKILMEYFINHKKDILNFLNTNVCKKFI